MTRIPLPSPENMTPDQLRVYEEIIGGPRQKIVGALRAAIHCPELADRWQKFGALLRYDVSLPARLKEMVILVTARRWNSQVQWQVHVTYAREAGVPGAIIDAIRDGRSPEFADEVEAGIYDYTRELLEFGEVSPRIYEHVLQNLQEVGVVELTALIGYYSMVAMTLSAHEITLPDEGGLTLPALERPSDASAVTLSPLGPALIVRDA